MRAFLTAFLSRNHPPSRGGSNGRRPFGEGEAARTGGNGDLRALLALAALCFVCAWLMRFGI